MRLAEPGEFARRAFENGKLDLTEVEGLADLIDAETEAQRAPGPAPSRGCARARSTRAGARQLLARAALLEAGHRLLRRGRRRRRTWRCERGRHRRRSASPKSPRHLADGAAASVLRDGFRVVIAGAPNAGKSSLLNALARRDVAIVSEEAGTTRDVIEVQLDLEGLPVILTDTAGLREAEGAVESGGRCGARSPRAESADLVLWVVDATDPRLPPPLPPITARNRSITANEAS